MNNNNHSFPLDLLSEGSKQTPLDNDIADDMKQLNINAFAKCGIDVSMFSYIVSPTVVLFELLSKKGVKIKRIRSCEDKLNEALSDYGPVRLIAPVPEKGTIAVEVPRPDRQIVRLREVLESKEFQESEAHLPIALGIDSENNTVIADLAKMPHLLIAGAAGQGKSTLMKNIILSLIYRCSPADLKLVLIDPKATELCEFNTIKNQYLLHTSEMSPEVITDIEKVPTILTSIVYEVDHRFDLLIKSKSRTIYEYNQKLADGKLSQVSHHHLPNIIVIIDEFADLMITHERDFVSPLVRIAAKSKAVGIHLVIATQCPKTDVITGIIKANFSARIAFKVCSETNSKTILDTNGAEKLLGMGDMLLSYNNLVTRIQGCFVDTDEIESICDWNAKESQMDSSFVLPIISDPEAFYKPTCEGRDPQFEEVARWIVESQKASTSGLQRRFSIGYNRASKIMDQLEAEGIIGPQNGGNPRKVLITDLEYAGIVGPQNGGESWFVSIFKSLQKKLRLLSFEHPDDTQEFGNKCSDISNIDNGKNLMKKDNNDIIEKENSQEFLVTPDIFDKPYKFPCEEYDIIGDSAEIDKVIHTCGYINIDVADIKSTLSTDTKNYVTVGVGDSITDALEQSVENLPITINNVEKMLFQILMPNGYKPNIKAMSEFISKYGEGIDLCWGLAFDESLAESIKVILIASSK